MIYSLSENVEFLGGEEVCEGVCVCVRQTDRDAESVCVLCGGQQVQRPLSWKKSHRFREREGPVSMRGGSAPPKSAFLVCTVGPRARLWAGEG